MAIKREFTVTATFTDETLELSGADAQNFWAMATQYARGGADKPLGFVYQKEDGSACIYFFEHLLKVCRSAQTETETEDGKCKDLDLCATSESSDEPQDEPENP